MEPFCSRRSIQSKNGQDHQAPLINSNTFDAIYFPWLFTRFTSFLRIYYEVITIRTRENVNISKCCA